MPRSTLHRTTSNALTCCVAETLADAQIVATHATPSSPVLLLRAFDGVAEPLGPVLLLNIIAAPTALLLLLVVLVAPPSMLCEVGRTHPAGGSTLTLKLNSNPSCSAQYYLDISLPTGPKPSCMLEEETTPLPSFKRCPPHRNRRASATTFRD
jgi:hypothetical protein